jgi:3-methylcrotonyl-CoA carboxylase beta subunit
MARIESKLRPGDPAFQANRQRNEALAAELRERLAVAQAGGPEDARRKHTERGKLLPRQRVESLLDPGTAFLELSTLAAYGPRAATRRERASSLASGRSRAGRW